MKYSVIIPAYNAEKTINRCVDSLLEQKRSDIEIVLVNDGSKDSSGDICKAYAAEHNCVHYIEKENGGVSSARNAGLDAATGEYVLFVDSDDHVAPDLFANIDRMVDTEDADWIRFSVCVDNGTEKKENTCGRFSYRSREELLPHIVNDICSKAINGPWAKLYKRSIIEEHNIRFPEGASVGEDRVFNIVYSFFAKSHPVK